MYFIGFSPVLESCYTLVQKMELLTGVGGWPTSAQVDASTTMSAALGQVGSGRVIIIMGCVLHHEVHTPSSRDNRIFIGYWLLTHPKPEKQGSALGQ